MRQAGRYLPEYREIRSRHGFWEMMRTPELAVEVTLQPIRRFGMDAAIVFNDILTALDALGVEVRFERRPGDRPVAREADWQQLPERIPEGLRLPGRGSWLGSARSCTPRWPLLGFSGAPFTLAAYLTGEGPGHDVRAIRALAQTEASLFERCRARLVEVVAELLGPGPRRGGRGAGVRHLGRRARPAGVPRPSALPYTRQAHRAGSAAPRRSR